MHKNYEALCGSREGCMQSDILPPITPLDLKNTLMKQMIEMHAVRGFTCLIPTNVFSYSKHGLK